MATMTERNKCWWECEATDTLIEGDHSIPALVASTKIEHKHTFWLRSLTSN